MSQRADTFKLGLFVLVALGLAIGGVIALGASELFEEPLKLVTYIDESVKGLEVGSTVRYRGVPRGKVSAIRPASEALNLSPQDQVFFTQGQYVQVEIDFEAPEYEDMTAAELRPVLDELVQQGLRVQLSQNPLTGRADIEIDQFDPKKFPKLELNWTPKELYIPWAPATLTQVKSAAERILESLESEDGILAQANRTLVSLRQAIEKARIDDIQNELLEVLSNLSDKVSELDVSKILSEISDTLGQVESTVSNLDREIQSTLTTFRDTAESASRVGADIDELLRGEEVSALKKNLVAASESLPETLENLDRLVLRLDSMVVGQRADVQGIVENLRDASRDLKELARNGRLYPSWILFGAPPTVTEPKK
ncbi:MAG: MlaD family protein [Planctomycetota bacterium]